MDREERYQELKQRLFEAVCADCAGRFPEYSESEPRRITGMGRHPHLWNHKDLKYPEGMGWPCKGSEIREIFIEFEGVGKMSDFWRKDADEPEDNQSCHIRGEANFIRLNVVYKKMDNGSGWLDFFATSEAGAFYSVKDGVIAWCPAELIPEPPDEWFDETGGK